MTKHLKLFTITSCIIFFDFQYMTEGILLREMLADPLLQKYGVIMIDEAHERNILTDIVLGLLKKIIKVSVCVYIKLLVLRKTIRTFIET